MEALSIWHIIILAVVWFGLFGVPAMLIIRKAGYSPAWILAMFVPLLGFIMLWVFALSRWPVERAREA